MARTNYKQSFERLYGQSSPEAKALFDNPLTRENVPELYSAWQRTQGRSKPKTSRRLDIEAEARARVYHDLDTMFLGFMDTTP